MRSRRRYAVLPVLLLALGLGVCGSDDSDRSDREPVRPYDTGSSSATADDPASTGTDAPVPAPAPGTATLPAETASAEPGATDDLAVAAAEWTTLLETLVDPDVPVAERAALIEPGGDYRGVVTELDAALAGTPVTFDVTPAGLEGDRGAASVLVTADIQESELGAAFLRVDGTWLLERSSACRLIGLADLPCPVASS